MLKIDLTLPTPHQNIAFEQAMFDAAEINESESKGHSEPSSPIALSSAEPTEFLRFWEPQPKFVVLGRSGKIEEEAFVQRCREDGVEIIRRASGGGTILTGAGCLMYSVVLSSKKNPALRDIGYCHQFIAERMKSAFAKCGKQIELHGHSDLCVQDRDGITRKFSGNAMRLGRSNLIYHGTLLISFELGAIARYLQFPSKRPDYRDQRSHLEFVTNIEVDSAVLKQSISVAFGANQEITPLEKSHLLEQTEILVAERYSKDDWNFIR